MWGSLYSYIANNGGCQESLGVVRALRNDCWRERNRFTGELYRANGRKEVGCKDMSVELLGTHGINRHSLVFQQLRVMVLGMVVVGVVFLSFGIAAFYDFSMQQILKSGGERVDEALTSLKSVGDPILYVKRVREVYREHSAEQGDDDYAKYYADIVNDSGYQRMVKLLQSYSNNEDVDFCFVAFTDSADDDALVLAMRDDGDVSDNQIGIATKEFRGAFRRAGDSNDERIFNTYYIFPRNGIYAISSAYLDDEDHSVGSLYFAKNTDAIVASITSFVIVYAILMFVVIGVGLFFANRRLKRLIVEPLEVIATAVQNYSRDKLAGQVQTRHFATMDVHTDNEIDHLASVLASMEDELYDSMQHIKQITVKQERENTELRMAAQIQQDALPSVFPAYPDRSEFDIYATMHPAREVGGDFYDHFLVDDDHLCILIADVSDKGVPSALFMMTSKTMLQGHMMAGKTPAHALMDVNNMICGYNRSGMFVTVWVGVLEISTGVLTTANAGHEYPAMTGADGRFMLCRRSHGLVIGGLEGMTYEDYAFTLRPGARVFVYTDGVPEAMNAEGKMFGLERMVEALNKHNNGSVQEVLEGVRHEVGAFVGNAEQFDDMTMLCLEYRGADAASREDEKGTQA